MKLYYAPGACSLSPHIALRETGMTFDLDKVDLGEKKTSDGGDFTKINPLGYVPALELDNGDVLTEGAVIVQYLADQAPAAKLLPESDCRDNDASENRETSSCQRCVGSPRNTRHGPKRVQPKQPETPGEFRPR